uniref:Uncharacterized protein n=1 Tax=Anguilla anguilla TaxID=7936 RepID=A0A0E9W435_ANGAN
MGGASSSPDIATHSPALSTLKCMHMRTHSSLAEV